MKDHGLGVDVIINDIQENPRCTHGPTVLFERFHNNGESRQYYACSACRDRRDCSFYHLADQKFSQAKEEVWQDLIKKATPKLTHKATYNRLKAIQKLPALQRAYCLSCSMLLGEKKSGHGSCTLKSPLFDSQILQPSLFLPPKESSRFEAQYMFSTNSVEVIMEMLGQVNAKKVLCLGTPRIFEAILSSSEKKMSALLMDIDDRYSAFFSPSQYIRYNMFNHHFFDGKEAKETYEQFIKGDEKLVLISDPPFGGRMELLAHNMLTIQKEWRAANNFPEEKQLSVMFIFPYFMEPQVLEQMPNLLMLDYQVDYDNHPLYSAGPKGMMYGSAVRVYVNDSPSLFVLPEHKGYRLCKECDRYVRSNNIHCTKCKGCMSKDGRTYKHCDKCEKCVKPSWIHCRKCQKCQQQDHKCGDKDDTAKRFLCHVCGKEGHKRVECPERKRSHSPSQPRANKKQKINSNVKQDPTSPDMKGKKKQKKNNKKLNVNNKTNGATDFGSTMKEVIASSPDKQNSVKKNKKKNLNGVAPNLKNEGLIKKKKEALKENMKKNALKENRLQKKKGKKNKKIKN